MVPGGPADKAGQLNPGDKIISVGQGLKGTLTTLVYSSSEDRTAPMPSRERLMLMSKFSAVWGEKYWVWGSKIPVKELM
ncbi:PDZ domain-containing protein [Endozoicomonas sp. SESOKO3]|uniref:PDZ domain-containing protein n=1 Tax=Endozoicomonas sp. SESOKO3 TaxID=2828744 RepID=UPI002147C82F